MAFIWTIWMTSTVTCRPSICISAVLAHNEKCGAYAYRRLCLGGCRAAGMLAHPGDILAPDESTCLIFLGGWLQRIEARVGELRATAECRQRRQLRELGREDELPREGRNRLFI